jgi:hypothetical protein
MWTLATRGRMAKIERKTNRYPSDLTDEEWTKIEPFLPRAAKSGRPIEVDLREVLNAIRYIAWRSGGDGGCCRRWAKRGRLAKRHRPEPSQVKIFT